MESKHYRVHYREKHEQLAGKTLELAEAVWPTLAKAYDAYDNYQIIDIFLVDPGDVANGNAIYTVSRVYIYTSHINWVMRGRRNWLGNVVTHELAHVFTLRRQAYLSPFDAVGAFGGTLNRRTNYSFGLMWLPRVAPTWYVEGVAQLEAEVHGYDTWDSQRDLIVRDAWMTNSLPTLGEIETFDGNWISAERVYNTGFAFLRFLRDKYGLPKVRSLADPKPVFNFSYSVEKVYGKSLSALYEEWKAHLNGLYGDYKGRVRGTFFVGSGDFNHSLAFSPDGRYVAWIGNDERDAPMDYVYWKEVGSKSPAGGALRGLDGGVESMDAGEILEEERPWRATPNPYTEAAGVKRSHSQKSVVEPDRKSKEFGARGLAFNPAGNRLLTTRSAKRSPYNDIWEYDFKNDEWERLTWNQRASYAGYHPFLDLILFVESEMGSSNIAVLDSTGAVKQLTRFREGQQVYNPRFNPAGDSIYFTLGIQGREAIAKLPLTAEAYDPFAALADSAAFPDSLLLGARDRLTFVTHFDHNLDRDLYFSGDTLYWSSYYGTANYNVYARLPGDSAIYQVTQVPDQALQPVVHNGELYFQGYQKQRFEIYRHPLAFRPTNFRLNPGDSLALEREKSLEYTDQFKTGEYKGNQVAWDIMPYASFYPQFVNDTSLITNLGLGLQVAVGDLTSYVSHTFGAEINKELDLNTPLSYRLEYQGRVNKQAIRHTRLSWIPQIQYGLSHNVIRRNLRFQNSGEPVMDVFTPAAFKYDPLLERDVPIEKPVLAPFYFIAIPITQAPAGNPIDTFPHFERLYFEQDVSTEVSDTYQQIHYNMPLPLKLMTGGRFYRLRETQKSRGYYRYYLDPNYEAYPMNTYVTQDILDSVDRTSEEYQEYLNEVLREEVDDIGYDLDLHKHYYQWAGWQGVLQKRGELYPTFIGGNVILGKYWTQYADRLFVDTTQSEECARFDAACGNINFTQERFHPWQVTASLFSAYSFEKWFTIRHLTELGFFSDEFPTRSPDSDVPHGSLFPLYYRLGVYRMPGYPYNFVYGGRDIMRGTALFYTGAMIEFPYKFRQYFDSPYSFFTSLNQVKLSFMGNMGSTLDAPPDRIYRALNNQENELLFDYGVQLSFNFQMFHALPMTLFFQVSMPYNQLENRGFLPGDLPVADWDGNNRLEIYTVSQQTELDGALTGNDAAVARRKLLEEVKSPRFYFGLQLGRF